MKKAILLFAVLLSFGVVASAQSSDAGSQGSEPQVNQQDKTNIQQRLEPFYNMINATTDQQEKIDKIAVEYYGYYIKNKPNYSGQAKIDYRNTLITEALKEAKAHLTEDQWNQISEYMEENDPRNP